MPTPGQGNVDCSRIWTSTRLPDAGIPWHATDHSLYRNKTQYLFRQSWCTSSHTDPTLLACTGVHRYWHFLYQHGTGAADSEGVRPETDTGNGWEVIHWVSTWWGIMGRGQRFKSRSDPKSPSLGVWLFLVQSVTVPVEHSSDVKQRPKKGIPLCVFTISIHGCLFFLQLAVLAAMQSGDPNEPTIDNNYRPVQALGSRDVCKTFDFWFDSCIFIWLYVQNVYKKQLEFWKE